jgi:CysZ protein
MALRALALGLADLKERPVLGVCAKSLLISLLICVALGFGLGGGLRALMERWLPGDSGGVVGALLMVAGIALAFLAFRAIAVPVTGFFADEVVSSIEARHYSAALSRAKPASFTLSLRLGLASILRVVLVNLAAMPIYIFLIFTAIGPLILFMALNAVLLGRDLAEMVVVRHLDGAAKKQWLRNHRFDYALLGLIVTGLFLIPFVNLFAPILGAAAAAHLFHGKAS